MRYRMRSDPALQARATALFGAAGRHSRAPLGLRTTRVNRLDERLATMLLEARGVTVVMIPNDVPTIRP